MFLVDKTVAGHSILSAGFCVSDFEKEENIAAHVTDVQTPRNIFSAANVFCLK